MLTSVNAFFKKYVVKYCLENVINKYQLYCSSNKLLILLKQYNQLPFTQLQVKMSVIISTHQVLHSRSRLQEYFTWSEQWWLLL